jgi:hypothetical protein
MFRSIFTTAHEPPEDDPKYGPKHLGPSFLKCVLSVNVN